MEEVVVAASVGVQVKADALGTCAFAPYSDTIWVAGEAGNVFLDPSEGETLI